MTAKIPLKIRLFEIYPEYVEEWRTWGAKLMGEHHAEALESLKEENLMQETMHILTIGEKWFLLYVEEGAALPSNPNRAINKTHKELLKKSVIRTISGEQLYYLAV